MYSMSSAREVERRVTNRCVGEVEAYVRFCTSFGVRAKTQVIYDCNYAIFSEVARQLCAGIIFGMAKNEL